jgi:hypothetical protein
LMYSCRTIPTAPCIRTREAAFSGTWPTLQGSPPQPPRTVGWSSSFIDYNNDGKVDLFKVNGELKHLYGQEDQIFENLDGEKFEDVSVNLGTYFPAGKCGTRSLFWGL